MGSMRAVAWVVVVMVVGSGVGCGEGEFGC